MAERRMFAKTIVLSDAFLDMPLGARCLYFTLGMVADDDGFVNSPKSVIRQCAATDDDLKILIAKKFIIAFQNGVIVIKHWKINNYIRNDRYIETKYQEQMATLSLDENNAYTVGIPNSGIPSIGKVSIDKDSIDKSNINIEESNTNVLPKKKFTPPTVDEVKKYLDSVGSKVDAEAFVAFYDSKNWMVGKNKMASWKSAIVTWEKRNGLKRVTPKVVEPEVEIEIYEGDDW